jgi:hypothetical protein
VNGLEMKIYLRITLPKEEKTGQLYYTNRKLGEVFKRKNVIIAPELNLPP